MMRVACVAVLLLLAVSCARSKPEITVPEPKIAAPQPGAPRPAPTPLEPTAPRPKPATAPVPAPRAGAPAQPAATKVALPVAKAPAPAPSLDLTALEERLKDTKAIGLFTKIALKNKIDDLLDQFRAYHQGKATVTMTELRRSYELLMMKVLSLLQDDDQALASAIASSREAIWGLLADPRKFATLQG
jgi:hypothetical protein